LPWQERRGIFKDMDQGSVKKGQKLHSQLVDPSDRALSPACHESMEPFFPDPADISFQAVFNPLCKISLATTRSSKYKRFAPMI
jgi:hypothetical protein